MTKVTVFIPYYNDAKYLKYSIESVLNQSFEDLELLLINHASTDNSKEIARSYTDPRIKHIDLAENLGAGGGHILDLALKNAQGEYLKFFCADDILKENCLERQVKAFEEKPSTIAVFAGMSYIDDDGNDCRKMKDYVPEKYDRFSLLRKLFEGVSPVSYPTAMARIDALRKIEPNFLFVQSFDVTMWIQLCILGEIEILPEPLVNYRIGPNQISNFVEREDLLRRIIFEIPKLLKYFYKIKDLELLLKVFPEIKAYYADLREDHSLIPAAICLVAKDLPSQNALFSFNIHKNFAIEELYEMMQNEVTSNKIKHKLGFGIKDFRSLACSYYEGLVSKSTAFKNISQGGSNQSGPKKSRIAKLKMSYKKRLAQIGKCIHSVKSILNKSFSSATKDESFNPLISIIIPVFNGSNFLAEAINSALAQTYKNIEILVVNDGSNDDGKSREVAKSFGNRIRYFEKENGGVSSALNLGIREMKGEYFSWLSHDDIYYPNKVLNQINILRSLERKDIIIYGQWEILFDETGKKSTIAFAKKHKKKDLEKSLYPLLNGLINGLTLLIPRKCFFEIDFFDEKLKTVQDYDLWLKILRKYPVYLDRSVSVVTRIHKNSQSSNIRDFKEENEYWINAVKSLGKAEIKYLFGSKLKFYRKVLYALSDSPYTKALLFVVSLTVLEQAKKSWWRKLKKF